MASLLPRTPIRQLLRQRQRIRQASNRPISSASLPRILQPALWRTVLPRSLRPSSPTAHPNEYPIDAHSTLPALFRNPAVHVALLAVLCGSQAIHVLTLKSRRADADAALRRKATLLGELIERIKRGESVDVRAELGTGDPASEQEWEEVVARLGDAESWVRVKEPRPKQKQTNGVEKSLVGEAINKFSWEPLTRWIGWTSTTPPERIEQRQGGKVQQTLHAPRKPEFY